MRTLFAALLFLSSTNPCLAEKPNLENQIEHKNESAGIRTIIGDIEFKTMPGGLNSILDLGYIGPSPSLTLAYSAFIPGGGWFYLGDRNDGKQRDFFKAAFYFVTTIGGALFVTNAIKHNDDNIMIGAIGIFIIRISDITSSVGTAEIRRHAEIKRQNNFRKMLK